MYYAIRVPHCVASLLQMKVYKFGNLFLQQLSGIPIGGPISGAVFGLVCSRSEANVDELSWKSLRSRFGLSRIGLKQSHSLATSTVS